MTLNSIGAIANVLKDLGYQGFRDMQEMIIQVGFQEVTIFFSLILILAHNFLIVISLPF